MALRTAREGDSPIESEANFSRTRENRGNFFRTRESKGFRRPGPLCLAEPAMNHLKAKETAKARDNGNQRAIKKHAREPALIGQRVVIGHHDDAVMVGKLTGIGTHLVELTDAKFCLFAHGTFEYMRNDLNSVRTRDSSKHYESFALSRKSIEYMVALKDIERN